MPEYFSHDYDAREDEKVQELLFHYGMEGYGIYWSIVEMLYKNDGYMQMHCERIAYALHSNKDMISHIINDFGLFKINDNAFTSTSVLDRIKLRKGKTATARKAAEIRWGQQKQKDANALQMQSDSNAKKKRKEKKEKENKNCLLKNSGITIEDIRKAFLESDDLQDADPDHYFNSALDWSISKGQLRKDWVATIRNFARHDIRDGKLKTKSGSKSYVHVPEADHEKDRL